MGEGRPFPAIFGKTPPSLSPFLSLFLFHTRTRCAGLSCGILIQTNGLLSEQEAPKRHA